MKTETFVRKHAFLMGFCDEIPMKTHELPMTGHALQFLMFESLERILEERLMRKLTAVARFMRSPLGLALCFLYRQLDETRAGPPKNRRGFRRMLGRQRVVVLVDIIMLHDQLK